MQGIGGSQPSQVWGSLLEAWEQTIKKGIDAQTEWAQAWAQSFSSVKDSPDEVAEWARQGQDMVKRWGDTQKQLWEGWFQMVRKLNPPALGATWDRDGQNLIRTWQEMIKKTMDAQADWMRTWTVGATGDRKK
jgi:hypothetical protein